jgi:hypothetical protein
MNTIRKGKINRHEKITQVLLSGNPASPAEIAKSLKVQTKKRYSIACPPTFTISAKMVVL